MNVRQISDWALEDRLAIDGAPLVVLFMESGRRAGDLRRYEFRRVAREHPDVAFVEVDLVENPSLAARYSITDTPVVLAFVRGVEAARHLGGGLEATLGKILGPCA
jgi:thiol-disulfide isomerase/thioredoxin